MNAGMVRFSVVIPTYNRARLIGRAVNCALQQSFPCQEILVVDDGSTDDTAAVVRACGPRVQLIPQEHSGPSPARNRGVKHASAEWIAFLDSDDLWHPDYLERMGRAISQTRGEADLYFSDAEYNAGTSRSMYWAISGYAPAHPVELIRDASAIAMMGVHPMLMPFSVFRKEAYLALGGLWEELWSAEDTHLFIRMGLSRAVCAVSGSGGVVTADEGDPGNRLTAAFHTGTLKRWNGMVKMYTDLLANVPSLSPADRKELMKRLAHTYWRVSRISWVEGRRAAALRALRSSLRTDASVVPRAVLDAVKRVIPVRGGIS